MKRKIALLLAVVMILSLVPMMSFAASGNTKTIVTNVPRVADDYDSKVTGGYQANTFLVIEQDSFSVTGNPAFQLRIENAKWSGTAAYSVTNGVYDYANAINHLTDINNVAVNFDIDSRTDRVLDIQLNGGISGDSKFIFPLYFEADGKTGPIEVTIDPLDSGISGGTFTVANVGSGATVTTIDDLTTFSERGQLEAIRIEETSMGAFSGNNQKIRLRLPNNFEWTNAGSVSIRGVGGLNGKVSHSGASVENKRDLVFTMDVASGTSRGAIIIENAEIRADLNAREGDVTVRISGGELTAETITVAKYSDFDITVKADGKPAELVSGRFDDNDLTDEAQELQTLIIEEETAGALLPNRRTRVELPSWVKILGVDVSTSNITGGSDAVKNSIGRYEDVADVLFEEEERGESYIEFIANPNGSGEAKIELTFYVSVKADMEDEIVATVSGRSGAEGEAVLGEARRVVEASAGKATDLVIGKKAQPIADITISEIEDEDIMSGDIVVKLTDYIEWNSKPTVTVTDGDLEIDKDSLRTSGESLYIPIKSSGTSSEASTIVISDAKVDVTRIVAEGSVTAGIRGDSLRKNHIDGDRSLLKEGYFDQTNVVSVQVAQVVTPAQGGSRSEVSLTIGVVPEGGDVAPYLANNRTYAPVSAVAQALGISKNNIIWNEANRTVTVFGDKTVQMTIGSTTLLVNGTPVVMDAAPEITSSRTFLPIAWLAKALDVAYTWDAATQTVTFY